MRYILLLLASTLCATAQEHAVQLQSGNNTVTLRAPSSGGATTYTFPSSSGNSGQVLVADGNGSVSWQEPASSVPTGAVMMFAGGLVPQGWLRCDGSEVSRVTYAQLFAEIGTTYGSGDNVTTFNLPDLGGRFPLGQGSGVGLTTRNLGSRGGEEDVTLTVAEMPSHTHDIVRDYNGGAFSYAWGLEEQPVPFNGVPATTTTFARGGDQAHNNMPPFLAIDFIIKY